MNLRTQTSEVMGEALEKQNGIKMIFAKNVMDQLMI